MNEIGNRQWIFKMFRPPSTLRFTEWAWNLYNWQLQLQLWLFVIFYGRLRLLYFPASGRHHIRIIMKVAIGDVLWIYQFCPDSRWPMGDLEYIWRGASLAVTFLALKGPHCFMIAKMAIDDKAFIFSCAYCRPWRCIVINCSPAHFLTGPGDNLKKWSVH